MQVEILNEHTGACLRLSWAGRFYFIKMVDQRGMLIVCRSSWRVECWLGVSVKKVTLWDVSDPNIGFRVFKQIS